LSARFRFRPSLPTLLLILAIIAYAVTFSVLTIVRYAAFESRALDMGNLNQAIWNTAHGNWFHLTNQPGTVNRLSLHVEPILLPIAALYRLYPHPPTLLVLQALIVALGALPLFALARHRLQHGWAALAFALVYLLNPTLQAANWLEFHPVTLAPTFLLAAFYALITERRSLFALFAVLAASCKEEIALLVLMMGAYLWWVRGQRRWGLVTMSLALVWALLAVFGFQQLFADGNIHWSRYAYLGDSPGAMVWSLLTRPDLVLAQLQRAEAGRYLFDLLWPTAFTALFAPATLLIALPSLSINLLADFPPMHEVHTLIYAAPIIPFVLAAAVMGTANLVAWAARRTTVAHTRLLPLLAGLILLGGVVDQRLHGYLPGSGNAMPLQITDHHRRAAAIIAQIPPDAAVSAQDRLNPHVSGRETVYIFPRLTYADAGETGLTQGPPTEPDADTVLLDVTGPAWPQHPNDLRASVDTLLAQGFGVAAADDGYLLLRRGLSNTTFPPDFYAAWRRPDLATPATYQADFGDALRLLDVEVTTNGAGEVVTALTWLPQAPLTEDWRFYVAYVANDGTALHTTDYYQPISVLWYPTTLWEAGVPVRIETLPWALPAERFTLVVGVYRGDNWAEGQRLPVTAVVPPLPVLEGGTLLRVGGFVQSAQGAWQPLATAPPSPALPLAVRFGPDIHLDGAALPRVAQPGDALPYTLYWRTMQPLTVDYTVFAHLLDAQGNKVAQLDWQPHDPAGVLPMSAWLVDQPVIDRQSLPLPPDLPPGDYWLQVGLYDWRTGSRLAPAGDAGPATLLAGEDVVRFGPIRLQAR
jgi:uncharacterized membrane protein